MSMVPWFSSPYNDVWDPFDLTMDMWWDETPSGGGRRRRGKRGGGKGGGGGANDDSASVLAHVNVDWRETDNAHIFHVDLPGAKKQEVKVEVEDGNILQISGEYSKEQEDTNDKWHRVERRHGGFLRRFKLPENTNVEGIKCNMENGVLNVVVPKKERGQKEKNVRAIDIQ